MNIIKVSLVAISIAVASYSQAKSSDELAKRVFLLNNFTSFSVSSGIDVYLEPSTKTEAVVIADKEVLDRVEITQKGSEIKIKMKSNFHFSFNNKSVKVYLSYKQLNGISASGGSDIYMKNNATLKSNSLEIAASGGSDLKLNIDVANLSCALSGGCDVYLTGNAATASFSTSGGSDVKAKDLNIKTCKIDASGGSDSEIRVTEKLEVNASGSSDVYYYGNPKQKNISSSGASDVKSR